MHIRIITAAAALVAAGALAVPTAANATPGTTTTTNTVLEEHGMAIPSVGTITPNYSVSPEGGGSWTYGTNGPNNTAFSNFYHASRKHGSSVQNGRGQVSRSRDTLGGATAKSSITKTFAGNNAYYRFVK
ncbi:lactococcin 972 family bacteriocin [Curtobacterium sp. PhB130]|uniref:lactococcin 972 family bacteriocin n=1 Tax=Curtobacterium sp. PhB130 TaxID=2485178 RepID=UPI000FAF67B6|nr:lactococcin 972 family bacteriocin [Curtobacterium sp. PhB130]ROS72219.1 lactococcin 972 family bacteriocin [Curtobacterium sp. PhB130]